MKISRDGENFQSYLVKIVFKKRKSWIYKLIWSEFQTIIIDFLITLTKYIFFTLADADLSVPEHWIWKCRLDTGLEWTLDRQRESKKEKQTK